MLVLVSMKPSTVASISLSLHFASLLPTDTNCRSTRLLLFSVMNQDGFNHVAILCFQHQFTPLRRMLFFQYFGGRQRKFTVELFSDLSGNVFDLSCLKRFGARQHFPNPSPMYFACLTLFFQPSFQFETSIDGFRK